LDTDLEIIDHNGEKWVTVKQLAEALGYTDPSALSKLIRRKQKEFANKIRSVKLTELESQAILIINYHGVLRASMLTEAPRGPEFLDWAQSAVNQLITGCCGDYTKTVLTVNSVHRKLS
jgi:prophage antirepressor-like protein